MGKDLTTERVLAFTDMELARRDGDLEGAAAAQRRLHGLGVLVRYVKAKPSQSAVRASEVASVGAAASENPLPKEVGR